MDCYYFICGRDAKETRIKINQMIGKWTASKELRDIVEAFGGHCPNCEDREELVKWLLEFSENWDYRKLQKAATDRKVGEAARWMIENDSISEKQEVAVFENIDKLGLRNVLFPHFDFYDYIVALGGARMSCLFRTEYARQLIAQMKQAPTAVILLSGMRAVADSERKATDTYAPDAVTEFDLMNASAEKAFGLIGEYEEEKYCHPNRNREWAIRTYMTSGHGYRIQSVSGPSSDPDNRRANSADTFAFFMERERMKPGSKVLLVTSQIYVPYQQLEAVRTLAIPHNVYVETVGFPTEWNTDRQGMMKTVNYLQEIRSTIQAISRYLEETREYGLID